MELEEIFERATRHARTFKNISEKEMLQLYGLYKHTKDGPCNVPKPHIFDFIGKAKWESWNRLKQLSRTKTMDDYIALVKHIDPAWDATTTTTSAAADTGNNGGLGVVVSTMCRDPDDEINECEKTVFDWCKEGDVNKLRYVMNKDTSVVHLTDQDELTLLHWAVDHGFTEIVELLLACGCDIDSRDAELQTPLHYAVSCDHEDVARLLLRNGADVSLRDRDGNTPAFYCETDTMRCLFDGS